MLSSGDRLDHLLKQLPIINHCSLFIVKIVPQDVARYAYRQGLFVLAQSGESVVILNDAQFQPQIW